MMKYMGVPKKKNKYDVPEDMEPVYVHTKKGYENEKYKEYMYFMDAIASGEKLIFDKLRISEDKAKTYVRELREKDLIVLIEGRDENSLDYRDYVIGITDMAWTKTWKKTKLEIVEEHLGRILKGAESVEKALPIATK